MCESFDAPVSWHPTPGYTWFSDIFAGGPDWNPLPEIKRIYRALAPDTDVSFLDRVYDDITAMFAGEYPGFRGCAPCGYHDLRHTRSVALAVIRLLHGLRCRGVHLSEDTIQLGLLCAFFHDTGMLLRDDDQAETGSAYLKEHEKRSTALLRQYFVQENLCLAHYDSCAAIIDCTNLMLYPREQSFSNSDQMVIGQVVGSADIMAQMADLYYIESLPALFKELRSAGVDRYNSEIDLLRQTARFYHEVIEKRLREAFDDIGEAMRDHFRVCWNIDRNLYADFIENNIRYLEHCLAACGNDESRLAFYLRRQSPSVR